MTREIKFRHIKDDGSIEFELLNREASGGIVEQYTGLKDKNGKEIYEGDIIESTWNGDKAEVVWNDVEGEWEHYADFNTHSKYSGSVVIGNIHENPDLLK